VSTGPAWPDADARDELARLARLEEYRVVPALPHRDLGDSAKLNLDLHGLTELARRLTGAPLATVNVIDGQFQHSIATQGFDAGVCARDDSMCAAVFQGGETVVVDDASVDPRFSDNPFVTGILDRIRFYAATPLTSPGGHSIGTLCVADRDVRRLTGDQIAALQMLSEQVVDVLELHRRTRLLDEAVGQLMRSNTALAEFAGRVSHDLQAPLNSIVGFAEILSAPGGLDNDAEARRYLERIHSAGNRMHLMIRDLLGYAVAGAAPRLSDVDLDPLVDELIKDLDVDVRATGARFRVDVGRVRGDAQQLRALLQNLLTNAMKYRRPDVPCRISVDSRPLGVGSGAGPGAGWLLRVSDNGMGVPAAERMRILQPLARMERDWDTPGIGIGLATSERIAQAHGGVLELSDTPGGGTTVTLRVPPGS
jgi:signal transduction histidine kinase